MNVISLPLTAHLRLIDNDKEVIGRWHRMHPNITQERAEAFADAVSILRNAPVGNGFLTVNTELREAP